MIYKMSPSEIKKLLHDFYATRYGKSIFVICYVVPLLLFAITMGMFLLSFVQVGTIEKYLVIFTAFLCMNVFCIGSYFYYRELREFAEHKKK
ncbi:MAG: hypothetical protein VZS44_04470 [Bacilli bacterium]|nr:hypothetical protein [Bacilli bacterium]